MAGPPLKPVGFIVQRSQNGATFKLAHPENSGIVAVGDHVTVWTRDVDRHATAKVMGHVTQVKATVATFAILRTELDAAWPADRDILEPGCPVYRALRGTFDPDMKKEAMAKDGGPGSCPAGAQEPPEDPR